MTISLTHPFVSAKSDDTDTTLVRPSNWNAEHTITMATARLLGRTTGGSGAVEEISAGSSLTLTGGVLDVASIGGITTIASGSLSGAAVSLTSIAATYAYLVVQITGASTSAGSGTVRVRVDTDNGASYDTTAANYKGYWWDAAGTALAAMSQASLGHLGALNAAAATLTATVYLFGYHSGPHKKFSTRVVVSDIALEAESNGTYIGSTAAINAIEISVSAGTFDAGTYALYGVA